MSAVESALKKLVTNTNEALRDAKFKIRNWKFLNLLFAFSNFRPFPPGGLKKAEP